MLYKDWLVITKCQQKGFLVYFYQKSLLKICISCSTLRMVDVSLMCENDSTKWIFKHWSNYFQCWVERRLDIEEIHYLYLEHYLDLLSLPSQNNQTNGTVTRITIENFYTNHELSVDRYKGRHNVEESRRMKQLPKAFSHFSERSSSFSLGREVHHLLVRFSAIIGVVFRGGRILFLLPPPFSSSHFFFFLLFFCYLSFFLLHPPLPTVLLLWVARFLPLLAVRCLLLIVLHEVAQIHLGS